MSVVTGLDALRGAVDAVGLEARADSFTTRSIKTASKRAALDLILRCIDLTTLEGSDTEGRVATLCARARQPDPRRPDVPPVAAVCVYPSMVPHAVRYTAGSPVAVASVAGAFPSGLSDIDVRQADIAAAVDAGADEIDIVLNRSAFLSGDHQLAFAEVAAARDACGDAHLKVILEAGELGSYDQIRAASMLAMAAGGHFIKTSTGKISQSSSLPIALCMAEAIRDFHDHTGAVIGLKVAGGIRHAKDAWRYLILVNETLGPVWLTPELFRIGASSLLNDVILQLYKLDTGRYFGPDDVAVD